MGVMTMGMTLLIFTLHWPMWGSMLVPGKEEYTEEDYYLKVCEGCGTNARRQV
jgi:hypothetical protein